MLVGCTMAIVLLFFRVTLEVMWLETLILGDAWLSWKLSKRIILLWVSLVVSMSMMDAFFVLLLVFLLVEVVKSSSERIWGDGVEFILIWKFCIHSVLFEEPLESVDAFINKVLEGLVLLIVELLHLFLHLSGLLDEELFLFLDSVIAESCLFNNVDLEFLELIFEEVAEPFSDDNEIVKEQVFTVVKLVVCLFFVSIEDLNQWGSEVLVLDLINGANGVVVESSHDISVLVELLEYLVLVVIEFATCLIVLLLEDGLQLLQEKVLGYIEETLLGADDLLVVEFVVVRHGGLVLKPLVGLALVELSGGIKDDLLELFELGEDLGLDFVVVVLSLVSIELLGKIGDGSPQVVLLLLELVGNDLSGISRSFLDLILVKSSLHFDTLTNVFNTITEGGGGHCEGALSGNPLELDFLLFGLLQFIQLCQDGVFESIEGSDHLDNDQLELF